MAPLKTTEALQQRRQEQAQKRSGEYHLNLEKPPTVYARQSGKDQPVKNKEAAAMQTDDLLDLAEEYGWVKISAWLFVENYYDKFGNYNTSGKTHDASGKLRIDQRAGLQHVILLVETDQTSAVICRETSRLFRDETLVGPVTFADACREHNVVIITPHHVYDFNAPGRDDFNRFIEEAKVAAAYLKNMREIAYAAKYRKGARGKYSGHAVPTGLMLDDSRENYLPNPIWGPIVSNLTRRYRQLDGSIALLRREIIGKCIFPDLPPDIEKRIGTIYLEKVQGGYTIKSRAGLIWILVNPANMGHMHFDGEITKRNAHTAIVDEDDYLFALYHLADVDLDGRPIERPNRAIRIQHKGTIDPRDGLLTGVRRNGKPVLTTDQGYVYLFQLAEEKNAAYTIKNGRDMSLSQYTGSIMMDVVDRAFEKRLLTRLDDLFYMANQPKIREGQIPVSPYESAEMAAIAGDLHRMHEEQEQHAMVIVDHFHHVRQDVIQGLAGVERSIAELKRQIAVLKHDLDRDRRETFMDAIDREDVYSAMKHLRADLAAYERKQKESTAMVQAIEETGKKLATARDYWPSMTLEKKKIFVRLVTQDILLHDTGVGFMEMTVTWNTLMGEPRTERAIILQRPTSAANWTEEEIAILKQQYPHGTKRETLHLLPQRSWRSCVVKASRKGIERYTRRQEGYSQSDTICLNTMLYMDAHGISDNDTGVWWENVSDIKSEGDRWHQATR